VSQRSERRLRIDDFWLDWQSGGWERITETPEKRKKKDQKVNQTNNWKTLCFLLLPSREINPPKFIS